MPRAIGRAWNVPIGPLGVLLQVREEGRIVAIADAVEDGEVDLHQLFDIMEDPADGCDFVAPGELLDRPVGEEVDVELRPEVLDRLCERGGEDAGLDAGRIDAHAALQELAHHRQIVPGVEREAVVDHHGLHVVVEDRAEGAVFEAADLDDLIVELIFGPAQALQFVPRALPHLRVVGRYDEHLEVGLAGFAR